MTPGAASRRRIATLADETHLPRVSGRADRKTSPQAVSALPANLSEAAFQSAVIDVALWHHWRVVHYRPALSRPQHHGQTRGWSTPLQGHPGAPDLILARHGQVILAELKRQNGRLTPDQRLWLAALGGHGRCWRPSDWPTIVGELRDGPGTAA